MKISPIRLFVLLLLTSLPAVAADLPGSYIEQLDSASRVFTGRITAIQPVTDPAALGWHAQDGTSWGRATFDLTESLVGDDYTAQLMVALPQTNQGLFLRQQMEFHTFHVGDSGIWIFDRDGFVNEPGGFLDERNRAEVLRSLHVLQTRKWSPPVNGLGAWSVVVNSGQDYDYFAASRMTPNPVMLFAVQNVTTNDLYLPTANEPGFIRATVTSEDGHVISANPNTNASRGNGLIARKLASLDIIYFEATQEMHPGSHFDLARALRLEPGKYSVVISCVNSNGVGRATYGNRTEVTAWTGELKAPPVELEILPDAERRRQAEARTAAFRASHPPILIGPAGSNVSNTSPLTPNPIRAN